MKGSVLSIAVVIAAVVAAVAADEPEKIGQVRFPISCSAAVQKPFERAVALLHSFWYLESAKAFAAIAQTDPDCAMAYWGLAMSNWTQIWSPPPPAALKRGWEAVEKAKVASAKLPRERDFVAAAEAFFKDADKLDHRTRAVAYGKAMEQMAQRYPDDREVMAFYALSLQATADPHDKTYSSQKRSAELAEKIFAAEPDHPGAAHYMIHGYDYPHRLLSWVAKTSGVDMTIMDQSDPIPLDALWTRDDMGCVFMCGYPWALRRDPPALLASPVPSPPRYSGRAAYVTDFIVRADSPYATLCDTFGGAIAYSTEHSHSGYNAPRYHLLEYLTSERRAFYRAVLGPLVRQRPCLDAVVQGVADVAAIDGYALDLLCRHDPAAAARVRVIETTAPAPSPPLVASPGVDPGAREWLTRALTEAHYAADARPLLDDLLLARFDRVTPADFAVFLDRERAARDAGYPKLA